MSEGQVPAPGSFGTLIRQCRLARGLSQEELADQSGLSVRAIANIERGRTTRPHRYSVQSLGDALALSDSQRRELDRAARMPGEGVHSSAAETNSLPILRQLPAPVAGFVGRTCELDELTGLLESAAEEAACTVVISAIGGTAGVGKTALAVQWAHQVVARFPDGQLYVNLRGFDPGQPMSASSALAAFLRALGVPGQDIPAEQDERAARYRSLLADRRMLVVLDNAWDEGQVRPLLPGGPRCLVLVTSRNQLAGLVATEGAHPVTLGVLSEADATQMLGQRIGAARLSAEPNAAAELTVLCARLPLALAIAAARASLHPDWDLGALASELRDAAGRLDGLDTGSTATSVRAAFSWSYRQLSPQAARMFRLLGLHPGPDIPVPAAASLAGTDESGARRLLGDLARANLITEQVPGRYTLHDLLGAYAAELAHAPDNTAERDAATGRILDHYLHTAAGAAHMLNPAREPIALTPPRPGAAACPVRDYADAMAWFHSEHQVLLAAVGLAARTGNGSHAWQLPWALGSFLSLRGHWHEAADTQRTALAAATRMGDTAAQALTGRLLANACSNLGDHEQASRHYVSSLTLHRQLGNRRGEARIHQSLGVLAERQGYYAEALDHGEQALRLYQEMGDMTGQAEALNEMGWYRGLLGDYEQARALSQRSLALSAEAGHRWKEGNAWDTLGYAEHHLGNLAEAAACYQRALSCFRESGDRFSEALTLSHLGDTRQACGETSLAQEVWQQALTILDDLQDPSAGTLRAKLRQADSSSTPRLASP